MFSFDPLVAARKAIKMVRSSAAVCFQDGPVGDLERDALVHGVPAFLERSSGYIYIAANASWPGLYKIGCTRQSVSARMKSLHTAGMVTPWVAVAAWEVYDATGLEARVHRACAACQIRGELFEAPLERLEAMVEHILAQDRHILLNGLREPLVGMELESLLTARRVLLS